MSFQQLIDLLLDEVHSFGALGGTPRDDVDQSSSAGEHQCDARAQRSGSDHSNRPVQIILR
jgi:hypothetical protein